MVRFNQFISGIIGMITFLASSIVPPLFAIVRNHNLPTTLRTSALSLLAQCADTSELALLSYTADLADAMVHLLQIESARDSSKMNNLKEEPTMDSFPTAANPKFPPFRRAALHFLALLVRAYTRQAVNEPDVSRRISSFPSERVKTVSEYLAATDVDDVVRVMARELVEAVDEMEKAASGL
jgi:hypothetical protein